MSAICTRTACTYTGVVFFSCVKFKIGMPAVSFITMPSACIILRIYRAVILVLAMNSLKMKQMVDFLFYRSRAVAC